MTHIETTDTSLTITRTFEAPRERVFRAFVDPEDIEAWQSIGGLEVDVESIVPEPGGSLAMAHTSGDMRFFFEGTFLEVVEPERLVHTLQVVEGPFVDETASRITVEFRAVETGTEVTFTEERIDPEMLEETVSTWDRMFDRLDSEL